MEKFKIYLANPRGYCAGVRRAIEIVERALEILPLPIYVKHEVVHNKFVVDDFRRSGVIFIEDLNEVPRFATLIFSAHGVSQEVREVARKRELKIYDATCPLVTKVHNEVMRYSQRGLDIILIGHENHPEVIGTLGQYDPEHGGEIYLVQNAVEARRVKVRQPNHLAYVTQTTLSIDDTNIILSILKKRYPKILSPSKDDICYATQNRQDAVKELAKLCQHKGTILIIGSKTSSNSNRLVELARAKAVDAYLIDSADNLKNHWLENRDSVGVSAGASAPEFLVEKVVSLLQEKGGVLRPFGRGETETVTFSMPKSLQK